MYWEYSEYMRHVYLMLFNFDQHEKMDVPMPRLVVDALNFSLQGRHVAHMLDDGLDKSDTKIVFPASLQQQYRK